VGANFLWAEAKLREAHAGGTLAEEVYHSRRGQVRKSSIIVLKHANLAEQDWCGVGIGCDTLAIGSQVVHAAQARVLDVGSFDVNGLKLLPVFLVDECDGDVVGSAKLGVMEGEHFSTFEETNTTQQKDFGLLAVAAWSVQVFAAPKAKEQC
jgi:hypothetical protein